MFGLRKAFSSPKRLQSQHQCRRSPLLVPMIIKQLNGSNRWYNANNQPFADYTQHKTSVPINEFVKFFTKTNQIVNGDKITVEIPIDDYVRTYTKTAKWERYQNLHVGIPIDEFVRSYTKTGCQANKKVMTNNRLFKKLSFYIIDGKIEDYHMTKGKIVKTEYYCTPNYENIKNFLIFLLYLVVITLGLWTAILLGNSIK
jgi:hypothetical protein